jgi:hypothetical protein
VTDGGSSIAEVQALLRLLEPGGLLGRSAAIVAVKLP